MSIAALRDRAPLKVQNATCIWTVVAADTLTLTAFAYPAAVDIGASWLASGGRIGGASIAPVVVLLLTSLLPPDVKGMLVYWRVRKVLPGHRAFSVHAAKDSRVDLDRLRAALGGEFPTSPRDQNTTWYRLFKQVDGYPEVAQAHRHFLLFRELAAVSLLLGIVAPLALHLLGAETAVWVGAALFGVQYLATAAAARMHGVRLVRNVLALYGAAELPKARAAPKNRVVKRASSAGTP